MGIVKLVRKRRVRHIMGDWAFLTPQLLLYVGFTLLPFFLGFPVLFTNRHDFLEQNVNYVGLDNFTRIFRDEGMRTIVGEALWRTVRFTTMNYVMVFAFGLTLALLMYEIGFRGGFFTVIYLPTMISSFAIGYIADMLFGRSTGTINHLLVRELGWLQKPLDIKSASGVTFLLPLVVGWQGAGFNMALFLSGLTTIPIETIEASIVDGATYWQRLRRIYFPQMIPSFIIVTIFCVIGSFGVFDILIALGGLAGNPATQLISVVLFRYGFGGAGAKHVALGITLALEVGIPLIIIALLLQRLQKRLQY